MPHSSTQPSFLFVCTGNICRSPLAEIAMKEEAKRLHKDLYIDSAGIGNWHQGQQPDPRARKIAKKYHFNADHLSARQITKKDFDKFTHIIALDKSHLRDLKKLQPNGSNAKILLLLDFVTGREGQDVVDPYYGSEGDFEITWNDVKVGCRALAEYFLK